MLTTFSRQVFHSVNIVGREVCDMQQRIWPASPPPVVHYRDPLLVLEYLFGFFKDEDLILEPRNVLSERYGKIYFGLADGLAVEEKCAYVRALAGNDVIPLFFSVFDFAHTFYSPHSIFSVFFRCGIRQFSQGCSLQSVFFSERIPLQDHAEVISIATESRPLAEKTRTLLALLPTYPKKPPGPIEKAASAFQAMMNYVTTNICYSNYFRLSFSYFHFFDINFGSITVSKIFTFTGRIKMGCAG